MKIRIGLKSGKVFEFEGDIKGAEELYLDIINNETRYLGLKDGAICIETSSVEYIEEVKEKKDFKINVKIDTTDFQKVLKEAQVAIDKLKNYDTSKFI